MVLHLRLIILSVGDDVTVDSDVLLVIDFVNLKIKPTQSFKDAHRGKVCVHIFI
jgi:outer membrane protein W